MTRCGTSVDAVFVNGSIDSILSLTDSVRENDIRVGFFLQGEETEDVKGRYYRITAPSADSDYAVGMCVTSAEEGTEPTDDDIRSFRSNFDDGILLVVDPYACEFSVYKVDRKGFEKADVLISE